MAMQRFSIFALLATLCALQPSITHAADVAVHPVVLELSGKAASGTIALTNRSAEPVRFHVTAFAWRHHDNGEMILEPTKDIVFFPAMLTLGGKESRQIRVGTRVKPGAVERAYRVFVQELPPMAKPNDQPEVRVLTKMGLPIFLAAAAPKVVPSVSRPTVRDGIATFAVQNAGNSHLRVQKVMVWVTGPGGKIQEEEVAGWYVLANSKRRYEVPLSEEACKAGKVLELRVESEQGNLSSKLEGFSCH